MNHYRLGDQYAQVVSEGLKSMNEFKRVELAKNRLTEKGADAILGKINSQTEVLDLSDNKIGKLGFENIGGLLKLSST